MSIPFDFVEIACQLELVTAEGRTKDQILFYIPGFKNIWCRQVFASLMFEVSIQGELMKLSKLASEIA